MSTADLITNLGSGLGAVIGNEVAGPIGAAMGLAVPQLAEAYASTEGLPPATGLEDLFGLGGVGFGLGF